MHPAYKTTVTMVTKDLLKPAEKQGKFARLKGKLENYITTSRKTKIITAIKDGNNERLEKLLHKARYEKLVNSRDKKDNTMLILASRHGTEEIVRILLEHGATPNSMGADYNTALMAAACRGNLEIARLLIKKQANVDAKDVEGWTSLMFAAVKRENPVLKLLLDAGADITAQTTSGFSAYSLAEFCNNTAGKHLIGYPLDM